MYHLVLQGPYYTAVKQCKFHGLISNDIAQKYMVLNSFIIDHLIMITCVSYKIIFTISVPKLITITQLYTCVIHVTDSIRHCNTDYSSLERSNIYIICYLYGKCVSIADAGNPGAVSIRKTVLPGMAIPMLKIRRPNGRLIFNMEIAIRR